MFKVNEMVTTIDCNVLDHLIDKGEIVTYTVMADLFYEGQIPVVAYLIIEGHVHLLNGKKVIKTISGGHLVGAKELMTNTLAKASAKIMPQTKVCFLSKSDLLEIIEENNELSEQLDQLIGF